MWDRSGRDVHLAVEESQRRNFGEEDDAALVRIFGATEGKG